MQTVPGNAGHLFLTTGSGTLPNGGWYFSNNAGPGMTLNSVANVAQANAFGFGAIASGQSYPSIFMVGWLNSNTATATSVTIGTPNCSSNYCWTIGTGFNFMAGDPVNVEFSSFTNQILGTIASYNSSTGAIVVSPISTVGSGASTSWTVNVYGIWRSINFNPTTYTGTWAHLGPWPNGNTDSIKTISGDPGNDHQVYIGFSGSGYMYGYFNFLFRSDFGRRIDDPAANDNTPVFMMLAA
jgi:hypothetical protein